MNFSLVANYWAMTQNSLGLIFSALAAMTQASLVIDHQPGKTLVSFILNLSIKAWWLRSQWIRLRSSSWNSLT
jgi:hypothetical protein